MTYPLFVLCLVLLIAGYGYAEETLPYNELKGHTDQVGSVAFFPDGKKIVTTSSDKTARIWDAESKEKLQQLDHTEYVGTWFGEQNTVLFSPDGKKIVTVISKYPMRIMDADGETTFVRETASHTIRFLDVDSGKELQTLEGRAPAFSPNGKKIVTINENTVRIWDLSAMGKRSRRRSSRSTSTSHII